MPSLNQLPELCLLEIFDRLPLHQVLYKLPLVCRRWCDLAQFSEPARRRSLDISTFNLNDRGAPPTRHNTIKFIGQRHSVNDKCLKWIVNTFPKLTSLNIHFNLIVAVQSLPNFVRLLHHLAPSLVKLTFDLPEEFAVPSVFNLFNHRMPALKELQISLAYSRIHDKGCITFPVLKQLTSFRVCLDTIEASQLNQAVLCYLEASEHLTSMEILMDELTNARHLLSLSPKAARKVTKFEPIEEFATDYQTMQRSCLLFASLTEFTIDFLPNLHLNDDREEDFRAHHNAENLTLAQLLTCIRPLAQLNRINLRMNLKWHSLEDMCIAHQLSSVRTINWEFHLKSHSQIIEAFDFGRILPQLESASIEFCNADRCKECTKHGNQYNHIVCLKAICDHVAQSSMTVKHVRVAGTDSEDECLMGPYEIKR